MVVDFEGWDCQVHRELPRNLDSEILSLRILSLRIDCSAAAEVHTRRRTLTSRFAEENTDIVIGHLQRHCVKASKTYKQS